MATQNPDGTIKDDFPDNQDQYGLGRPINLKTSTSVRTMVVSGAVSVAVEITSVGTGGTFKFQDKSATWVDVPCYDVVGNAFVAKGTVLGTTGTWLLLGIGGMTQIQVAAQALSAGAILGQISGSSLANVYTIPAASAAPAVLPATSQTVTWTSSSTALASASLNSVSTATAISQGSTSPSLLTDGQNNVTWWLVSSGSIGSPVFEIDVSNDNVSWQLATFGQPNAIAANQATASTVIIPLYLLQTAKYARLRLNTAITNTGSVVGTVIATTVETPKGLTPGPTMNDGANAAALGLGIFGGASAYTLGVQPFAYAGSAQGAYRKRSPAPTITSTANQSVAQVSTAATGSTALWTPTSGKKFRLMRYMIVVTSNASITGGAMLTISLLDSATNIGHNHLVWCPTTAIATGAPPLLQTPWIDLGDFGYLSTTANNVLNASLSAALTTGDANIIVAGIEE